MKYKERDKLVAAVDELHDWIHQMNDAGRLIELPAFRLQALEYVTEYHKNEWGSSDFNSVDEFNTRLKMRKITRALKAVGGKVVKKYYGDSFETHKDFGGEGYSAAVSIRFQTRRDAICRKVVTEKIEHPAEFVPSHTKDAWTEEKVEWVCDDPLLAEPTPAA